MSENRKKRIPMKKGKNNVRPAGMSRASAMDLDDRKRAVRAFRHATKVKQEMLAKATRNVE